MCRNESDAEDLVQDTFLNVYRFLKDFRYETSSKLALPVAANTSLKRQRRSKFRTGARIVAGGVCRNEEAELIETVPDWARMPLDQILNDELLETSTRLSGRFRRNTDRRDLA